MSSREKILSVVKQLSVSGNEKMELPVVEAIVYEDPYQQFCTVLQQIGATIVPLKNYAAIQDYVLQHFGPIQQLITTIPMLESIPHIVLADDPHQLENIEWAIVPATFAVAENGAIWTTESDIRIRVLPFICQHLAVVLTKTAVVHNMHEAYEKIGSDEYNFGLFIAGPSKTADIEQSLVLGAHGPKTMTVFVIE
jgi:L-lactate dehydrogenase complex protein LldG